MLMMARQRLSERGTTFEALSPDEQFVERHASVSVELTKWVKRLRKNYGAPLRLLLVAEAHKSGLPHYHGLIHEQSPDHPLRHALLSESWRLGFTKFKLVPPDEGARRTSWYVCKYLTKDNRARVRASVDYGAHRPGGIANNDEYPGGIASAGGNLRGEKVPPKGDAKCPTECRTGHWPVEP